MFAWENGVIPSGRIRRESGSWGFVVMYKVGTKEEVLINNCGTFPPTEEAVMPEEMGSVGCSCGTTINMGNYESARVDCWCTLPCKTTEVDDVYDKCYDFVTQKVEQCSREKVEEARNK
jgi:hypothetical protein